MGFGRHNAGGAAASAPESTEAQAQAGTGDGSDRMSARRTKAAIDTQAPTATRHIARFAAQDSDTEPSDALHDGEIGLYEEDGSTEIQSGDVAAARVLYLPKKAAAFGVDVIAPGADLGAYDVRPLGANLVANAGSDAIIALTAHGQTETVYLRAGLIEAYGTAGYKLSQIEHLKGGHTPASYGIGWDIVVARTHGVAVSGIVDALDKLVFKVELAGREEDRFASYNSAFIGSAAYRAGLWVLTSDTAGAPTSDNQIGQPDIASGSGTVCFGRLRTDADPNDPQWDVLPDADDYPSGDTRYASIDGDKSAHLKITLTSAGVKVEGDTDDGDYVYARADWVETGDIADVADYGDYFRIGREVPSKLKVELPWTDILGAPWMEKAGAGTGDTAVAQDSFMPVRSPAGEYEDKSVAHMGDHIRPQLTAPRVLSATYETVQGDIDAGDGKINVGAGVSGSAQVTWGVRANEAIAGGGSLPKADILKILTLHHRITVYAGSKVLKGTISGYGGGIAAYPYQVTVSDATKTGGAFADGDAIKIKLESALVDRDELAAAAFSGELTDLEGVPDVPASNGAYRLRATRSSQGIAFSWVADS